MTPLAIEICIHYHCSPEQYRDGDFSAPAVMDTLNELCGRGLLHALKDEKFPHGYGYQATDGMRFYIEALNAVPLPERRWCLAGAIVDGRPQ